MYLLIRHQQPKAYFLYTVIDKGAPMMNSTTGDSVCLFSAMCGIITVNQQPQAHLTLTRTAQWQGIEIDTTVTDADGYFEFPSMFVKNRKKFQTSTFLVTQNIFTDFGNKNIRLWLGSKLFPQEFSESRGEIISVRGELTEREKSYSINSQVFLTLFDWAVVTDSISASLNTFNLTIN